MGKLTNISLIIIILSPFVSALLHPEKYQVYERDWSYVDDLEKAYVVDSRVPNLTKVAYGICDINLKKGSTSCTFCLEPYKPAREKPLKCDTHFRSSDTGFIQPIRMFDLTDNQNKLIIRYIADRNYRQVLVIRLIDMITCKSRDLTIETRSQKVLSRVIAYKDSFDVIYNHETKGFGEKIKYNVVKMTFDKNGEQIGEAVAIFANIPDDEISPYVDSPTSPLSLLVPIIHDDIVKGYILPSANLKRIRTIAPDGQIIKSREFEFVTTEAANNGNNGVLLLTNEMGNGFVHQINEDLEVVQMINIDPNRSPNEDKRFSSIFVDTPTRVLMLVSDSDAVGIGSQKNFYLRSYTAGQNEASKDIYVGNLLFDEDWEILEYLTHPNGQICMNALSIKNKHTIEGLKYVCVPESDL